MPLAIHPAPTAGEAAAIVAVLAASTPPAAREAAAPPSRWRDAGRAPSGPSATGASTAASAWVRAARRYD